MFKEKSFQTDGIVLSYDEGSSSGPPMLLLHGLTGSREAWQPNFVAAYGETWHQYIVDQRGHGKSGRAKDANHYRLLDYAGDIAAFLQDQVADPAVVVGHSLGAINSIGIGAMVADRVRGLILIDPPLFCRNQSIEARPGARGWFSWVYDTTSDNPVPEAILKACRESNPQLDEAALHDMADHISSIAPGTVKTVLDNLLLADFDLAQALRQISCPTLLIYGDWDHGAVVCDDDVAFVRENLPHVTTVKIENGDHMFAWERWEETQPHIDAFFATL